MARTWLTIPRDVQEHDSTKTVKRWLRRAHPMCLFLVGKFDPMLFPRSYDLNLTDLRLDRCLFCCGFLVSRDVYIPVPCGRGLRSGRFRTAFVSTVVIQFPPVFTLVSFYQGSFRPLRVYWESQIADIFLRARCLEFRKLRFNAECFSRSFRAARNHDDPSKPPATTAAAQAGLLCCHTRSYDL